MPASSLWFANVEIADFKAAPPASCLHAETGNALLRAADTAGTAPGRMLKTRKRYAERTVIDTLS